MKTKVKVRKIRFAFSSPILEKLFRIEETFVWTSCLEIYQICVYLFCVWIIGIR